VNADSGALRFVDIADPSWTVAVAWCGAAGRGERWRQRSPVSEGLSGKAIRTGRPVVANDIARRPTRSQLAPADMQAGIGVPLRDRDRVLGALAVGSSYPDRQFGDADVRLLAEYAAHAGVVLSIARAGHAVEQAFTDSLTGLGNRALLLDCLEQRRPDRRAA
jgi:GAF domain-containing protein